MKRKIIKQGHNTLTITLPSKWVQKLKLTAKDEVDISEKNNNLVVSAQENRTDTSASIDISGFTIPLLWRYFQSAYRSGHNEIKVYFDPSEEYEDPFHYYTTHYEYNQLGEKVPKKNGLAMVQQVVDRFLNIAIIKTGKDFCVIREMGEPTMKEFDNSLRRIFMVLLQLFDRVTQVIQEGEGGTARICKEIHTIDLNIDKFVDYCCRIMNTIETSFPDNKKSLLFSTLYLLELVGDEFKEIGKHLAHQKEIDEKTLKIIGSVQDHFRLYYELFYKFTREKSIDFGKHDCDLFDRYYDTKEELDQTSRSIARHFMMISKYTLALAELRIQMNFEEES